MEYFTVLLHGFRILIFYINGTFLAGKKKFKKI